MRHTSELRAFLTDLLANKGDSQPFADGESLLLSGRLQSIDAVEIVVFLEEKFAIDFAEIGFDEEMLDSLDAICALLQTSGKLPSAI
jgi:acyl carrier protein